MHKGVSVTIVAIAMLSFCGPVVAQNSASNKAVFAYNPNGISITPFFSESQLFHVTDAIKTSSNGNLLMGLSMECALYTYNNVTGSSGGGKNSSSARATVRAYVYVDGQMATPDGIVFCDRMQSVGVTLATGVETDSVTVELFQATKNANHFNFFAGPLAPILHTIEVRVSGDVSCTDNNGLVMDCPKGTLAGMDTGTFVAVGKSVLTIEEYNNANR